MKLIWTDTAKSDLVSIFTYIASDNRTAAKRLVNLIRERARNVILSPLSGRKVPELSRDDIRELIEGNYRIVYQVLPERILILTVFEGHRLLPPIS